MNWTNFDRLRVKQILDAVQIQSRLAYPQWRELGGIVERNQNDGAFNEAEWVALRDWHSACQTQERAYGLVTRTFDGED